MSPEEPRYWISESQLAAFEELSPEWASDTQAKDDLIETIRENQTIDDVR